MPKLKLLKIRISLLAIAQEMHQVEISTKKIADLLSKDTGMKLPMLLLIL
jgi:hypothetical protein